MSNGTRWLSRFKKEKGEEVDSNFINYKLSLYNLNKTTLGLPILYINLYTGVALHLLKKITANTAPGSSSIMDAIWRQMTCLSQQLFYGRWHDQYLYNYFKTKSEKIKRDGIITQKERKSQRKCIYAYFNSIPNFNTWLWQRGFLPVLFHILCYVNQYFYSGPSFWA